MRPVGIGIAKHDGQLPAEWGLGHTGCGVALLRGAHLAALDGAPLNPVRVPGESALRFRVGNRAGYGAAPEMARRALERMDEDGITGRVRILHVLSDTDDVYTQGPVWRLAGRTV